MGNMLRVPVGSFVFLFLSIHAWADETVFLNTRAPAGTQATVSTNDPLVDGMIYEFRLRGTWSAWFPATAAVPCPYPAPGAMLPAEPAQYPSPGITGVTLADSLFFFSIPKGSPSLCTTSYAGGLISISALMYSLDDAATFKSVRSAIPSVVFNPTHEYSFSATGKGMKAALKSTDAPQDNHGQIRLEIIGISKADAGPDKTVLSSSEQADLDGSASVGSVFSWTQISGRQVTILDADQKHASFLVPSIHGPTMSEDLIFSLTASNGQQAITSDSVKIVLSHTNYGPTSGHLEATPVLNEGDSGILSAVGFSDRNKDTLAYHFIQISGPTAALSKNNSNDSSVTFTAPAIAGPHSNLGESLVFRVDVTDGVEMVSSNEVSIMVINVNKAPLASVGSSNMIGPFCAGERIKLEGSASDPDGDALISRWFQLRGTRAQFVDDSLLAADLILPQVSVGGENLDLELSVRDGDLQDEHAIEVKDALQIIVKHRNESPVASAGANQTVDEGSAVRLSSAGSYDPEGDSLSYHWEQIATSGAQIESPIVLDNPNSAHPTFNAPMLMVGGKPEISALQFMLRIEDTANPNSCGGSKSSSSVVTINVKNVNHAPDCSSVRPSLSELWPANHQLVSVTLSGGSDPDGDAVSIRINNIFQSEPTNGLGDGDTGPNDAQIASANSALLRAERSGKGDGRGYSIRFSADDGYGQSCSGSVNVFVPKSKGKAGGSIGSFSYRSL